MKAPPGDPEGTEEKGAEEEVAARFAALWHALGRQDGTAPDARRLLVDRVRDALDRGLPMLDGAVRPDFVANSFLVEDLVHESARTQIHRLRQRDLGTPYALKSLHPAEADNPVLRTLLLREAGLHKGLRDAHLVAAHLPVRLADGRPALVLEWMAGGSLAGRLKAGARFAPAEIGAMMTALLLGLKASHDAGIVHADITPANLLFASQDAASLKIADFGVARRAGERPADWDLAAAGATGGGPADAGTDLRACGRVLALLLERADTGTASGGLQELARLLTGAGPSQRITNTTDALALLREA